MLNIKNSTNTILCECGKFIEFNITNKNSTNTKCITNNICESKEHYKAKRLLAKYLNYKNIIVIILLKYSIKI